MKIEAYIPNWPGTKQHAKATADLLRPHCHSVTILDNPDHYFTEQFNSMREQFNGDIMLWVMADVWPPEDVKGMIERGVELITNNNVGIYAPDVDWNGHK